MKMPRALPTTCRCCPSSCHEDTKARPMTRVFDDARGGASPPGRWESLRQTRPTTSGRSAEPHRRQPAVAAGRPGFACSECPRCPRCRSDRAPRKRAPRRPPALVFLCSRQLGSRTNLDLSTQAPQLRRRNRWTFATPETGRTASSWSRASILVVPATVSCDCRCTWRAANPQKRIIVTGCFVAGDLVDAPQRDLHRHRPRTSSTPVFAPTVPLREVSVRSARPRRPGGPLARRNQPSTTTPTACRSRPVPEPLPLLPREEHLPQVRSVPLAEVVARCERGPQGLPEIPHRRTDVCSYGHDLAATSPISSPRSSPGHPRRSGAPT